MTAGRDRLHVLLRIRSQERDRLLAAYEQIRELLSATENRLRETQTQIDDTIQQIGLASATGLLDVNVIARRRYQLLHLRRSAAITSFEIEGIAGQAEQAKQSLVEADQQVRVVERLIERDEREARKQHIKREQREAEDLWVAAAETREADQ